MQLKIIVLILFCISTSAIAIIIPETAVPFNDVNQLNGEGQLIEACNAASTTSLTIPGIFTFEGYTDPNRGTLDHLYVFPDSTTANNLFSTNYYKPSTHTAGYETISGLTEGQARTLFETVRAGTGAAPQRTRLYFEGLNTNVTYLIQILSVNDSHTDPMNALDANNDHLVSADDTQNAVMLFTFRGKPRAANDDFVYFYRGSGSAEIRAYQIRQLDGFAEPPDPAHLTTSLSNGFLRIQSTNLSSTATNVLQYRESLSSGTWSNIHSATGVLSTNWTLPAQNSGFYRIESFY